MKVEPLRKIYITPGSRVSVSNIIQHITCRTVVAANSSSLHISPVPCEISFKFFGDLQNYTFLESLGPTEPEK